MSSSSNYIKKIYSCSIKMRKSSVCLPRLLLFPFALRTYLGREKVYNPTEERLVRSTKRLRSRCQVCRNVVETDTFQSFVDKKIYKINHRFIWSDKCLVYLLSCKVFVRQCTSQTVDEFRYRWNNYKDNRRGNEHKQVWFLLISKSLDNNGFLEDTEITFIDKTDPFNLGVRTLGLIR